MNTFENDLFTTVDAILELLGQKPKYPHVTQTEDISMHPSAKWRQQGAETKRGKTDQNRDRLRPCVC